MKVNIEKESDGTFIAFNTTGEKVILIGTGDTIEETKSDFYNTIEEVKESYTALNEDIPALLFEPIDFTLNI